MYKTQISIDRNKDAYTPDKKFTGDDSFTFKANDGLCPNCNEGNTQDAKIIVPVADAFDKFCVKAKEKSFPIESLLKNREKLKEQLGIKDLLQVH